MNKRERSAYFKEWYAKNRDKQIAFNKAANLQRKVDAINHYGGKCACCGEHRVDFLAIDHIDGGGNQHRKETGNGTRFACWLKREGYPEGFQVLCHNCNMSKHFNGGKCIHQIEKEL